MDTILIWLVFGAATGLLGIFLVASERELKRKRLELEELKDKLSDVPSAGLSPASTGDFQQDSGVSTELVARNKDLLEEVSALSKKLEGSESRLEQLETLRAHLNSKENEITELRWERERLQAELATLKTPPLSTEFHPENATENLHNDAEIATLKEQLEASQAKVHELESAQVQPGVAEAGQQTFEELQRSLEINTMQLQNALAAEQDKQKALEATQLQLAEMQQRYHELSEANLRLRDENSQHEEKLSNQNQLQVERLVILRQRLEQLRWKQAEVGEQSRWIQDEIVSMSQLLEVAPESTQPPPEPRNWIHDDLDVGLEFEERAVADKAREEIIQETPFETPAAELNSFDSESAGKTNGSPAEPPYHQETNLTAAAATAAQDGNHVSRTELSKTSRYAIFSVGLGALVIGGVFAAGLLNNNSEQSPSAPQTKSEASPSGFSPASRTKSIATPADTRQKENRSVEQTVRVAPAIPENSPVESTIGKPSEKTARAVAASTVWENYEVVQPTRVFSAPRADSQLIANIEPGTQVNVVGSRDGWLEIRSKHGRPPGFIHKDAAIRIGPN